VGTIAAVNRDVVGELVMSEPDSGSAAPAPTMGAVAYGVSWKVLTVAFGQGTCYVSLFVLAVLSRLRPSASSPWPPWWRR
jgi:hypothetical protein